MAKKTKKIKLKNNQKTTDKRLDRIYQLDLRSLNHLQGPSSGTQPLTPRSYTWLLDLWLDQGQANACVGNGFSHELAAKPVVVTGLDEKYAIEKIYWEAQKVDDWDGGEYPGAKPQYGGTSVLAGAKVLQSYDFYTSYNWGLDHKDIGEYLAYHGPVVLGINWTEDMFDTDENGFIAPTGDLAGGHCILAIGIKIKWKSWVNHFVSKNWDNVDLDKSYIILHNSWGKEWGQNGRAKMTLTNLDYLMGQDGEACFPNRNGSKRTV